MSFIRLDKFLSDAVCESRRDVKKYIKQGRVSINGNVCTNGEIKVNTDKDTVSFDFKEIKFKQFVYIMLNKPSGVVSAVKDKIDRTVIDLIKKEDRAKGLFPVGRLDKDTVGLIILTNNGDFAHNTLSPKKHINKTYYVEIKGNFNEYDLAKFKDGIIIVDRGKNIKLKSAEIKVINCDENVSKLNITISEGKFHQIKKMFLSVGKNVIYLKRIKFGDIVLDSSLKEGEYRYLNQKEMDFIDKIIK